MRVKIRRNMPKYCWRWHRPHEGYTETASAHAGTSEVEDSGFRFLFQSGINLSDRLRRQGQVSSDCTDDLRP